MLGRAGGLAWPTQTAHNSKEGAFPAEFTRNTPTLAARAGGALNPDWVEWLMGWPIGWTVCDAQETDKCRKRPRKRSENSPNASELETPQTRTGRGGKAPGG
jgi:hypothetical protein